MPDGLCSVLCYNHGRAQLSCKVRAQQVKPQQCLVPQKAREF